MSERREEKENGQKKIERRSQERIGGRGEGQKRRKKLVGGRRELREEVGYDGPFNGSYLHGMSSNNFYLKQGKILHIREPK